MSKRNKKNKHSRGKKLRKSWIIVAALAAAGLIAAIFGFAQNSVSVDYKDAQVIALGKVQYNVNCAPCHGDKGQGENAKYVRGGTKPDGSYYAPGLNGTAHTWHHPPDMLFKTIKQGSLAKNSPMRGWEGRMSDREIHAVLAYIKSLWPPELRYRYDKSHLQ